MSTEFNLTVTDFSTERFAKLTELCLTYNNTHTDSSIDLVKFTTEAELIISLWERKVDVKSFAFGAPYDEALHGWAPQYLEESDSYIYNLETNPVYIAYTHPYHIREFLYYSLLLPKGWGCYYPIPLKQHNDILTTNLKRFNEFWTLMGKNPITDYAELRMILDSNVLTPIQLCYLFFESENYSVTGIGIDMWDFLHRFNPK